MKNLVNGNDNTAIGALSMSMATGVYPGYADNLHNDNINSDVVIEQDGNASTFFASTANLYGMTVKKNVTKTQFKFNSLSSILFFGRNSGENFQTGTRNTIFGSNAMKLFINGSNNVAIGSDAMGSNTYADKSVAVGYNANNTFDSDRNNAIGSEAMIGGNHNFSSAIGYRALGGSGDYCIGVGAYTLTTHDYQVALGARSSVESANSYKMVLGAVDGVNGATQSTSVGIGTTAPNAMAHIKGPDDLLILLEDSINNNGNTI